MLCRHTYPTYGQSARIIFSLGKRCFLLVHLLHDISVETVDAKATVVSTCRLIFSMLQDVQFLCLNAPPFLAEQCKVIWRLLQRIRSQQLHGQKGLSAIRPLTTYLASRNSDEWVLLLHGTKQGGRSEDSSSALFWRLQAASITSRPPIALDNPHYLAGRPLF